jgi:hypothetical protein
MSAGQEHEAPDLGAGEILAARVSATSMAHTDSCPVPIQYPG